MLTTLKLDESAKLEFGVAITGADGVPTARFIIESANYSIMLPCKQVNENIEVEIPVLKQMLVAGEYSARLEVVLDNKIYTPLQESIRFEPSIEIKTKQKPTAVKESVKIGNVTVKKIDPVVNENLLRKTYAAEIIAKTLDYVTPKGVTETPEEMIEHAIEQNTKELDQTQINNIHDMLDLAESMGINADRNMLPSKQLVAKEIVEKAAPKVPEKSDDDDMSDDEIDGMINGMSDDDYLEAYDDEEFAMVDAETGEVIEEDVSGSDVSESEALNEILSRAERIKARMRMARTKTKREVKLKMALRRHSSTSTLNHRARRLAIKTMEKKLAKKPLNQLSVVEKERIERIIARRKNVLNRIAMKLVPRVRQVERDRLSHPSVTQSAQ